MNFIVKQLNSVGWIDLLFFFKVYYVCSIYKIIDNIEIILILLCKS